MYYFTARELYNSKTPYTKSNYNFANMMYINAGLYLNFGGYCLYNHPYQSYKKIYFSLCGLGALFIYNGFKNMITDEDNI